MLQRLIDELRGLGIEVTTEELTAMGCNDAMSEDEYKEWVSIITSERKPKSKAKLKLKGTQSSGGAISNQVNVASPVTVMEKNKQMMERMLTEATEKVDATTDEYAERLYGIVSEAPKKVVEKFSHLVTEGEDDREFFLSEFRSFLSSAVSFE